LPSSELDAPPCLKVHVQQTLARMGEVSIETAHERA
jgi:hypothetical protein